MKIGCIVMAAGQARRFGKNKLLASLGGKAVLSHVLDAIPRKAFEKILVVVSNQEVAQLCHQHGVDVLPYPGGPQSETVRRGIGAMGEMDGCMFVMGDQPLCSTGSIQRLASAFSQAPDRVFRLAFGDLPGSPAIFPSALFANLAALSGEQGGMAAARQAEVEVTLIQAEQEQELWDVDTPEALSHVAHHLSEERRKTRTYASPERKECEFVEKFKVVTLAHQEAPTQLLRPFDGAQAKKAHDFHASFGVYEQTPLTNLSGLAQALGVQTIHVKDESHRFGLNAFKVLGGSYALGRYIAKQMGEDIAALPASRILSDEVRQQLGEVTFVTATDGNHGRGVAWTANQLGQHAVVYMPRGSSPERLANIQAEGADASIQDMNYDAAVRLASSQAREKGWVMIQDTAWEGYTEVPMWIMQGYTTIGDEIIQQLAAQGAQKPTHVFIQAGVGSMPAAMAGFFAAHYGKERPFFAVVEPNEADCLFQTAQANDGTLRVVTGDMDTIMAGLACGEPCTIAWDILKEYADAFISCPDYAAADGMRILAAPVRGDQPIVSGESGAAPLGCVSNILMRKSLEELKEQLKLDGNSRLLFISTEGDTDKENYRKVVWGGKYSKVYED